MGLGTEIAVRFLASSRLFPAVLLSAFLAAVLSLLSPGASAQETPDNSAPKPAASSCASRAGFRVILDVGHTTDSPGAISARGVDEYDFNLRLGKRIERTLLDAGFDKTVLLVTGGSAVGSQYARVARANGLSANLLLSIHHDSVPNAFLGKWDYNGKPSIFSDRFKGHSIFVSEENAYLNASLQFGSLLGNQLKARGLQYPPHYTEKFMGRYQRVLLDAEAGVYRYDTLFVLKKSQMPAVLLEAGSIVNRDEEMLLATAEHQSLISAAVADAVDGFCVAQSTKGSPQVAQSTKQLPQVTQSARRVSHVAHVAPRHRPNRTADTAPITTVVYSGVEMR